MGQRDAIPDYDEPVINYAFCLTGPSADAPLAGAHRTVIIYLVQSVWTTLFQTALTLCLEVIVKGMPQGHCVRYDVALALRTHFEKSRIKNPKFSMRAFAKHVGLNHGAISEILRGKRRVSQKLAHRVFDRLCLGPSERMVFLIRESEHKLNDYRELEQQSFEILQDTLHFSILALSQTEGFRSDEGWIARRLRTSLPRVRAALDNLEAAGLIRRQGKRIITVNQNVRTTENVRSLAIQRNHLNTLEEAKEALNSVDPELRDFSSITLAFAPEKLSEVREILREAVGQIEKLMLSAERTEVYKISIQAFPKSEPGAET